MKTGVFRQNIQAGTGIAEIVNIISTATTEYTDIKWYKRWRLSSDSFIDELLDKVLVQNILPGTGFFHRWVFGWLFKWPYAVARWTVGLTGSPWFGLCFMALCILALHLLNLKFWHKAIVTGEFPSGKLMLIVQICNPILSVFMALTVLSYMVYFIPSLDNIAVMQLSGSFSESQINDTLNFYLRESLNVGTFWYVLFVIVAASSKSIDIDLISNCFLNSQKQHEALDQQLNYSSIKAGVSSTMLLNGTSFTKEQLQKFVYPYDELASKKLGVSFGSNLSPLIFLSLIINGTLVIFGLIYFGYTLLQDIATLSYRFYMYGRLGIRRYICLELWTKCTNFAIGLLKSI